MDSALTPYSPLQSALDETFQLQVPEGLLVGREVCAALLREMGLSQELDGLYSSLSPLDPNDAMIRSFRARKLLEGASLPAAFGGELAKRFAGDEEFSVYPKGSSPFDAVTRVRGAEALPQAVRRLYVDHLTNGLIQAYDDPEYDYLARAPEVIVQRSNLASRSGLVLPYEPDSGACEVMVVYSTWGLAEDILRRSLARDEYYFHKKALEEGRKAPLYHRVGVKEFQLYYDSDSHRLEHLPLSRQKSRALSLNPREALLLARAALRVQQEQKSLVKLYWSADDLQLFLLSSEALPWPSPKKVRFFRQTGEASLLVSGRAIGHAVASGRVRVVHAHEDLEEFRPGEVLVADRTEPDWEPVFRQAGAIVTLRDRRVSHSSILAREMGIPAVLEATGCLERLQTGQLVTVSCCHQASGRVLLGEVDHQVEEFSLERMPDLPTRLMVNLSMPERALAVAQFPWAGAGLVRSEFMIGGWVKVHPLALLYPHRVDAEGRAAVERICYGYGSGREYFVNRMSEAIGLIAGAFHPRPVTLRLSDFKSDEYARLLGGQGFEPQERNSLIGWRGASRYLHPDYHEAFLLELESLNRVHREMGLDNVTVLVPFCRTPEEGEEVVGAIRDAGLTHCPIWTMAELPSNVLLADEFAQVFDGMSIGSSDLTGLVLGVDRNSERLTDYFDELHPALMRAYETVIEACHHAGKEVSFCGQIASEDAEFAALLAAMRVDSLSLAPDALHSTLERLRAGF